MKKCIRIPGARKCVRCQRTSSPCSEPEFTPRRTLMQNMPAVNGPINPRTLIPSPLSNLIQVHAPPYRTSQALLHVNQFPQRTKNTESDGMLVIVARNVELQCPDLDLNEAYVELGRQLENVSSQRPLAGRPRQTAQNTADHQRFYNSQRSNHSGDLQVRQTQYLAPSNAMRRTSSPTRTIPSLNDHDIRPRSAPAAPPQVPFPGHDAPIANQYQAGTIFLF